jgi:hypothetical protein
MHFICNYFFPAKLPFTILNYEYLLSFIVAGGLHWNGKKKEKELVCSLGNYSIFVSLRSILPRGGDKDVKY